MKTFFLTAQLVISGLLILTILSQEKGAGLSSTFGGTGQLYTGRRGADKLLLWITVILAILFVGIAVGFLFIGSDAQAPAVNVNAVNAEGEPVSATPIGGLPAGVTVEEIPVDSAQ